MFRSAIVPRTRRSRPRSAAAATICVVDGSPDDYTAWRDQARSRGVRLLFISTAAEALRLLRQQPVNLWVVNTRLPDMAGCDLCGMLRSASSTIYMVADGYSAGEERAAWAQRASLFGCKGAHDPWLDHWLNHHGQTSPR